MSLASLINRRHAPVAPNVSKISNISISKRSEVERQTTADDADCGGALMADGPYLPWGPYLTPDRLKAMQQAVIDVVTDLARIEGWKDDHYDIIVVEIKRQPLCTLLPDLDYFRARLAAARSQ